MKKIVLFSLLVFNIVACKKGGSSHSGNGTDSSVLLLSTEKMYRPVTNQLTGVNFYYYDSKNRLTKEIDSPASSLPRIILYNYDNNSNNLSSEYWDGYSYIISNKDNKPNLLYIKTDLYVDTAQYYVRDSKVRTITFTTFPRKLYCYYSGDNLIEIKQQSTVYFRDTVGYRFVYGTHKSPFYTGGLPYFFDDNMPTNLLRGTAEVLAEHFVNTNNNDSINYTYTFNKYNYPLTRTTIQKGANVGYSKYSYIPAK